MAYMVKLKDCLKSRETRLKNEDENKIRYGNQGRVPTNQSKWKRRKSLKTIISTLYAIYLEKYIVFCYEENRL